MDAVHRPRCRSRANRAAIRCPRPIAGRRSVLPCARSAWPDRTLTLSEPLEAEGEKTEGLEPLRPPSDEPLQLPD